MNSNATNRGKKIMENTTNSLIPLIATELQLYLPVHTKVKTIFTRDYSPSQPTPQVVGHAQLG